MATISLEREIKLSKKDAKVLKVAKPTAKYMEALQKEAAQKTVTKEAPQWMRELAKKHQ